MKFNDVIQWLGTVSFLVMYTLMSLDQYPWNIVAGTIGGLCYLVWSIRVQNRPQLVTNLVAITICLVGLYKAFG
jgi:uncharacterized membrane protein